MDARIAQVVVAMHEPMTAGASRFRMVAPKGDISSEWTKAN
jgi:hypothetical protein